MYQRSIRMIYGVEHIAGFTEDGIPFGIFTEDAEVYEFNDGPKIDNEMPS